MNFNNFKSLSKCLKGEFRVNNSKLDGKKGVLPQLKHLIKLVPYLSGLAACFAILNNSIGFWQKMQTLQNNKYIDSSPSVFIYEIHVSSDLDNLKITELSETSKPN